MSLRRSLPLVTVAALGLAIAVTGAQSETSPSEPGLHQITLVGMVLRQAGPSFVIIQDLLTGKTEFFPLGSNVKGARLSRILPDRIVLTQGDARLVLRLGVAGARPMADGEETDAAASFETPPPGDARGQSSALPSGRQRSEPPSRKASQVAGSGHADKSDSDPAAPAAGGPSGTGAGDPSAQLRISGLHHDGVVKEQTQFTAAALRDLHLDVSYFQVVGAHRQRIEFFAPDGALYQRRFRDVIVTPGQAVKTRVPVGATWITDHSLFGNWRVVVYLDESQTPIATGAFALNP